MKKNRLLKILSSIFGVVAICGAFSLSLFDGKETRETLGADSVLVLSSSHVGQQFEYQGNYTNSDGDYATSFGTNTMWLNIDATLSKNVTQNTYSLFFSFNDLSCYNSYLDVGFTFDSAETNVSLSTGVHYLSLYTQMTYYQLHGAASYRAYFHNVLYGDGQYVGTFDLEFRIHASDSAFVPSYEQNDTFSTTMNYNTYYDGSTWTYVNRGNDLNLCNFNFNYTDTDDPFQNGYDVGYNDGYINGNSAGYNNGYNNGYADGVASQQQNIDNAYNNGYSSGFSDGINSNATAVTIFSGIIQIGMLPINFFLSILNFEIFGINLSGFIKAILTVCLTIIVVKTILGNSGGGA